MATPTFITPIELTLTTASAWTDIDVSTPVPAGATGVGLFIHNSNSSGRAFGCRKKGSTDDRHQDLTGQTEEGGCGFFIGVDANRVFQYWVENTTDISIWLVSYFGPEAVFFTNAVSYTGTDFTWVDFDISSDTGGDTALCAIWEVESDNSSAGDFGFRVNDSTDDYRRDLNHRTGVIVGVDGSEICEFYRQGFRITPFLVGYMTDGFVVDIDGVDLTPGSAGSYQDLTALPVGGIGQVINQNNSVSGLGRISLRAKGNDEIAYADAMHAFYVVGVDGSRVSEAKIEFTTLKLFRYGYFVEAAPASEAKSGSDSATVAIADTVGALESFSTRTDSVTVGITDSVGALDASLTRSDSANIGVTDASTVFVSLVVSDNLNVGITDASVSFLTSAVVDSLNIGVSDVGAPGLFVTGTDSLNVGITDVGAPSVSVVGTDNLSIGVTEAVSILTNVSVTDNLNIGLAEVVSFDPVAIAGSDSLNVGISSATSLLVEQLVTDSLNVSITDIGTQAVASTGVQISVSDNLSIGVTDRGLKFGFRPFYIDQSVGNDSNDGSIANPWLTIGKANSTLVGGDGVLIGVGTYHEQILPAGNGVDAQNWIMYRALGDGDVIVAGLPGSFEPQIDIRVKDWIRVESFNSSRIKAAPASDQHVTENIELVGVQNCVIDVDCLPPPAPWANVRAITLGVNFLTPPRVTKNVWIKGGYMEGRTNLATSPSEERTEDTIGMWFAENVLIENATLFNANHVQIQVGPDSHTLLMRKLDLDNPQHTCISTHTLGLNNVDQASNLLIERCKARASGDTIAPTGGPGGPFQINTSHAIVAWCDGAKARETGGTFPANISGIAANSDVNVTTHDSRFIYCTLAKNRDKAIRMQAPGALPFEHGRNRDIGCIFFGNEDFDAPLLYEVWQRPDEPTISFEGLNKSIGNCYGNPDWTPSQEIIELRIATVGIFTKTLAEAIAEFSNPTRPEWTSDNIGTDDPGFVDYNNYNFALKTSSVCFQTGPSVTTVDLVDTGSGLNIIVEDAHVFYDSVNTFPQWMRDEAGIYFNRVLIGTSIETSIEVAITAVNKATNTITVDKDIARSPGESVWIKTDSSGASVLEYGAAGPNRGASFGAPVQSIFVSDTLSIDADIEEPVDQIFYETGDALNVSILSGEEPANPVSVSDSLNVGVTDASSLLQVGAVQISVSDSLSVGVTELVSFVKRIAIADSVTVGITETSTVVTFQPIQAKGASDSLSIGINDLLPSPPKVIGDDIFEGTWEEADFAWGGSLLTHSTAYPVFISGNNFFQAETDPRFDGEVVMTHLERTGLPVAGVDRQGRPTVNPAVLKFVRMLYPMFTEGNGKISIRLGSQEEPDGPVDWEGPYMFDIGVDHKYDFTVGGQYLAIRFESALSERWQLASYTLDLDILGVA